MSKNTDEMTSQRGSLVGDTNMSGENLPVENFTGQRKLRPMEIAEELVDIVRTNVIVILVVIALCVMPILLGVAWYLALSVVLGFCAFVSIATTAIRMQGGNGWDQD